MKHKKEKEPDLDVNQEELDRIGRAVMAELNEQFEQWGGGLPYKTIMSSQSYRAKKIKMEVIEMAQALKKLGYIKVFNSPSGAKYVFSGECPLSDEEMKNWLQETEILKQTEREFTKIQRKTGSL